MAQSYREVAQDINRRAAEFVRGGFGKGDLIAILSENSCDWVIAYLAILQAGCVVVPLDSIMSLPDILHILELSRAKLVLCSERFEAQCREQLERTGIAISVRLLGHVLDEPETQTAEACADAAMPSDLAAVIFTSGTTGHSKGVMLTHENLVSNVLACCEVCEIRHADNFLLLLPLHHTFASTVTMLLPIAKGARATLATSYRSRDIVDDIRVSGVTVLVGVPQIFENVMNGMLRAIESAPKAKRTLFGLLTFAAQLARRVGWHLGKALFESMRVKAGLDTIRLMVSGGAALPPEVNQFFETLGFTLIQGYGLTECSPVLSVNPPSRNKIGSVGPALSGVTLRIKDANSAGIGEVCASGPNIMQGYFENAEASSRVLVDGWFYTGDAGFLDRDGYLYLTGRLKNVIVTSAGKNIYPEEIEAKLAGDAAVVEALVLSVPRKDGSGERLCALLKMDDEHINLHLPHKTPDQTAEEVIKHFNHNSPAYQRIREWQILAGEFEKTSTRKIKRFLYHNYFQ